jgi:sortase A
MGVTRGTRVRRRRMRRIRKGVGSSLILAGMVLLGMFAYQLWGTGIATSRAQTHLRERISMYGFPARPVPGGAVGFIDVPRIHLDMAFVQGVGADALAKGPGHYPRSPFPGFEGNVAIAGHRTTHLHPFWSLDEVRPGDRILLQTRAGVFVYRVVWLRTVARDDWSVIAPTDLPSLTLTTCTPRFTGRERLVVRAVQVAGPDLGAGRRSRSATT